MSTISSFLIQYVWDCSCSLLASSSGRRHIHLVWEWRSRKTKNERRKNKKRDWTSLRGVILANPNGSFAVKTNTPRRYYQLLAAQQRTREEESLAVCPTAVFTLQLVGCCCWFGGLVFRFGFSVFIPHSPWHNFFSSSVYLLVLRFPLLLCSLVLVANNTTQHNTTQHNTIQYNRIKRIQLDQKDDDKYSRTHEEVSFE